MPGQHGMSVMVGHSELQLFMALAREVKQRVTNFHPQGLVNTAWAFAKVGQLDVQLSSVLAREAERHVGDFSP